MTDSDNIARAKLRQFIQRIDRLMDERSAIGADIREVFSEAKGHGFEPKALRKVIQLYRMDKAARDELEALVSTYMTAIEGSPTAEAA